MSRLELLVPPPIVMLVTGLLMWLVSTLLPALFVAYLTRYQILPEERWLQEKFGRAYAAYKASVRRWI